MSDVTRMSETELAGFCRLAESVKGDLSATLTRLLEEIALLRDENALYHQNPKMVVNTNTGEISVSKNEMKHHAMAFAIWYRDHGVSRPTLTEVEKSYGYWLKEQSK